MNYYFSETYHFYFVRVRAEDSGHLESALKHAGIAGFVIDFGGERSAGVVGGRMNLFASARIRRTYSRRKIEEALGTSPQIHNLQAPA